MKRSCEPELLDALPHDHPEALHSRRDLRIVNRAMGNPRWFLQTVPGLLRPGEAVLELGAGSGELALRLQAAGIPVDGLDLCPRPEGWPADRTWHQADLLRFPGFDRYPVVLGNLILHQFKDPELGDLGRLLGAHVRVLVASEPRRRRLSQRLMAAIAPIFGANRVTLHDAHVSIGAGFLGEELPEALGLDPGLWRVSCKLTALGAFRMVAVRRD